MLIVHVYKLVQSKTHALNYLPQKVCRLFEKSEMFPLCEGNHRTFQTKNLQTQ